jgi:hypothetical protein
MKNKFDFAVKEVIDLKMEAVDKIVKEIIEPLRVTDNPEELIGKPYETWTAQDLQMLKSIYGEGNNTPLTNLIFKKTYERVVELERGEL